MSDNKTPIYVIEKELKEWVEDFNQRHNIPTVYFERNAEGKLYRPENQALAKIRCLAGQDPNNLL